jgi:hypothetical protein
MGDHLTETEGTWLVDHPWLDAVPTFIREALPNVQSLRGPTNVYAMYDEGPDRRSTLRYVTDDPEHSEVVVKVNHYSFLSGSAAAHRLVSRCSPTKVPKVLAIDESGPGCLILFAIFEGRSLDSFPGTEPLQELARTLGKIQVACSVASADEPGLETILPADLPRLFDESMANIEEHFGAWQSDEGKIEKAMGFPGHEVLERLKPLRSNVERWVEVLEEPKVSLSIDHGDCHGGNSTVLNDGTVLIFDWENACRSHPFFSMEKVLTTGWGLDTGNSGGPWGYVRGTPTQDEVKRAYLAEFGPTEPPLDRAFDAAMCLAVIKEMHHEMEWARRCGWKDLNPEWTAQLVNRLFEHIRVSDQLLD